jgi:hypothetical protein
VLAPRRMRLHRGSLREHQSRERCTFHSDYGESSSETSSDSFRLSVSGVSGPAESMHYERAAPVRNRSDLPPLAEQSCSRCASVENSSAVVQHLHGGAIYRVHRSTYSVDEQYSGEGCSTERPKTLTRVWGRFAFAAKSPTRIEEGSPIRARSIARGGPKGYEACLTRCSRERCLSFIYLDVDVYSTPRHRKTPRPPRFPQKQLCRLALRRGMVH